MTLQRTTAATISREIRLAGRPVGTPSPSDFELVRVEIPELADGQVLVRNTWMSVDPYMRGRMDDVPSYIEPFRLGETLDGAAVGEVVESRSESVPVGATVVHFRGWRELAVVETGAATVVDPELAPPQAYLGVLGTTGLTAWIALTQTAPVRAGDVVFVSAAAGAVGGTAGQLARKLGAARVIGSAGGPRKVEHLTDTLGFDVGLDYKAGPIAEQLAAAAPDGIDVYLDNVGGDHLEAAIGALRTNGRVALVGAISGYNATARVPGPSNLYDVVKKQATLRGMLVTSHQDRFPEWIGKGAGWLADGSLHAEETVVTGIENAPEAMLGLLRGDNLGKMLVRLGE